MIKTAVDWTFKLARRIAVVVASTLLANLLDPDPHRGLSSLENTHW
ncbi:MAG: hypothetical protein IIA11_09490 [Proteobacteria bacterium]|nr:hypothetical protein [Pseudomonadota bacterium]